MNGDGERQGAGYTWAAFGLAVAALAFWLLAGLWTRFSADWAGRLLGLVGPVGGALGGFVFPPAALMLALAGWISGQRGPLGRAALAISAVLTVVVILMAAAGR